MCGLLTVYDSLFAQVYHIWLVEAVVSGYFAIVYVPVTECGLLCIHWMVSTSLF